MNDIKVDLEKRLKMNEGKIKENGHYKSCIKRWIHIYMGKIVGFQAGGESFYFVFRKPGHFKIGKGEYPSCDVCFFRGGPCPKHP